MNDQKHLETQLDRLAQTMKIDHSQKQAIMDRVRAFPVNRNKWLFTWILKPVMSTPFVVFIIFCGWYFLLNNSSSMYAQAWEAIARATSVYAVGERLEEDGTWKLGAEVWYHKDYGVVIQSEYKGVTRVQIDDNQYKWEFSSDSNQIIKTNSGDPIGEIGELLSLEEFRLHLAEEPVIKNEGNETFHVYSVIQDNYRIDTWLDDKNRARKCEESRKDENGTWDIYERITVTYDLPMEKSRFVPALRPDSIVRDMTVTKDGTIILNEKFGLVTAVYQMDYHGLIFAVHEIQRLTDGWIFILTTMRPSNQLVKEFGPLRSEENSFDRFGDYQIDSSYKELPDGTSRGFQSWDLATLRHKGLYAEWTVLVPNGNWPEKINVLELSLYIFARGKLQERLKEEGKEWHTRMRPLTTLPIPEGSVSFDDLLDNLYETGINLEPVVDTIHFFSAAKTTVEDAQTYFSRKGLQPSWVTKEQYHAEYMKDYERYKRN